MNKTSWRFSRYAIAVISDRGNLVLYNSFYGSLARISEADACSVSKAMHDGISVSESQNPLLAQLIGQGFFALSNYDEMKHAEPILQEEECLWGANLIVLPNLSCNFRCQYCYERLTDEIMLPQMTSALIRYIKNILTECRWLNVSWYGGEPLMSDDTIINLLENICIIADQAGVYFRSGITTNGYLLDKKTAEKLISYRCNTFQITLDGPPEIHDQRRPLVNGGNTYDVIMKNILQLHTIMEEIKVIIRVNYDIDSLPFISEWISSLKEEIDYDERFKFSYHEIWDSQKFNYPKYQLCNYSKESNIFDNQLLYSQEDAYHFLKRATPNGNVCYAAKKNSFVILPSGKVLKCTAMLNEPLNIVGQLDENGKMNFDAENLKIWGKPKKRQKECNLCWYYPACRGYSCPIAELVSGLKDKNCPIGKHFIPKLLKACF